MLKVIIANIKAFFSALKLSSQQLKKQFAYEIKNVRYCKQSGKKLIEVKIMGKAQFFSCLACEVAGDDHLLNGFSSNDVRTIVSLAVTERYEELLEKERLKKSYDIIWSRAVKGEKTVKFKHRQTDEVIIVPLKSIADGKIIEQLESLDAYSLGYLAGQEQVWKDFSRLKMISRNIDFLKE